MARTSMHSTPTIT